ncbi:hypothetical protein cypCar_00008117 [Cyprinus carpio]|nr:hypothetical protein cypCar_00008117 [Cyprinus carpio]
MKKRINKSERKFQYAERLQQSGQKPKDLNVHARQVKYCTDFFENSIDLSRPSDIGLNHTINMYLTPEQGISLLLTQIYLNLSGFGDSTSEPTEAGLTTDVLYLYHWVKARSGNSPVCVWGHSLGSGVASTTAVKLLEQGKQFNGIILEGAFLNARMETNKLTEHPFTWIYRIAKKAQNSDERVKLVRFDGSLGYLHNGLYKDPGLPNIIRYLQLCKEVKVNYHHQSPPAGTVPSIPPSSSQAKDHSIIPMLKRQSRRRRAAKSTPVVPKSAPVVPGLLVLEVLTPVVLEDLTPVVPKVATEPPDFAAAAIKKAVFAFHLMAILQA